MRKKINTTEAIFPMPVLLIATYNEDGSVNVMNAAWGMMIDRDIIALNLTESHKTVKNIKETKAFTVSIADADHVRDADYFGVVSGNNVTDKLAKTNLTSSKSEIVNAPIINELPVCMECKFIEYQSNTYGAGVIGKVLQTTVRDDVMNNGKVDVEKIKAIAFDPYTKGYYEVTKRVGNAFKDGLEKIN